MALKMKSDFVISFKIFCIFHFVLLFCSNRHDLAWEWRILQTDKLNVYICNLKCLKQEDKLDWFVGRYGGGGAL